MCLQNGAAESRRQAGAGDNGLLAYLKGLEQENVEVLTRSASDDVIEAMNSFVQRMIGEAITSHNLCCESITKIGVQSSPCIGSHAL